MVALGGRVDDPISRFQNAEVMICVPAESKMLQSEKYLPNTPILRIDRSIRISIGRELAFPG